MPFLIQAQNQLFIPPSLTGTTFNLNIQSGTKEFYTGITTPTYGINGNFLAPTIIVNKGDNITLNVINNLNVSTTMHWHGLHVAPENDGGPHQSIAPGSTWSPNFEILNQAGTFWYHPHGHGKTDLHVSKGLAGMFIIHDQTEMNLGLPITYGVDDIPLIVQTKAFDDLGQIAIADHMDTAVFVNGTLNAFTNLPAQVIRLRLLNGSSMRTFNFGFSNNINFHQIATDGGLKENSYLTNRIRLAPGERAEILVDLSSYQNQTFNLMSFASELPNGIFGSPMVGNINNEFHDYTMNMLNGADINLLNINVTTPTALPISAIPSSLINFTPFNPIDVNRERTIVFDTIRLLPIDAPNLAEGPFGMNNFTFDMMYVNDTIQLNDTEIWTLINKTLIAHPFHIHDIQFNILEKNGLPPLDFETGWKDVVLVMPGDTVKFITKFTTFSDEMVPYMYHCHLLHHEDDGMMGSFLVLDPNASTEIIQQNGVKIYPNPVENELTIEVDEKLLGTTITIFSIEGKIIQYFKLNSLQNKVEIKDLNSGIYILENEGNRLKFQIK